MMTDPIADMLTRIRNANTAMKDHVSMPASKQKSALAEILKREGYIADYAVAEADKGAARKLTITLKYGQDRSRTISGITRVSTPRPTCRACSAASASPSSPPARGS
jgi:small subunit ribosomal protein S8